MPELRIGFKDGDRSSCSKLRPDRCKELKEKELPLPVPERRLGFKDEDRCEAVEGFVMLSAARAPEPDCGAKDSEVEAPEPMLKPDGGKGFKVEAPEPMLKPDGGKGFKVEAPEPMLELDSGKGFKAEAPEPMLEPELRIGEL